MQTHNPYYTNREPMASEKTERASWLDFEFEEFSEDQLFEHMRSNPLGRLLGLIASMPEVRREKVLRARHEIQNKGPEMEDRLDVALDRVLEELI